MPLVRLALLTKNFSSIVDIVPQHKPIQVVPTGEEDSSGGGLSQTLGELDVLSRLRPGRDQENIDGDPLFLT